MSDPILFESTTPRFALPLLFAGQAQKEAFVNEAVALTDALLHCAIEAIADNPPASPPDGANWLIGTNPSGSWVGAAGKLACRQAGNWLFVAPRDGMRLLNRATGQEIRYAGAWRAPVRPVAPSGGTTVDAEARVLLATLVAVLTDAGILAAS